MDLKTMNYSLVDTETVSEVTGISISTLKQWRIKGKGPSFSKFGAKVMYRTDLLEEWIDEHSVATEEALHK